MPKTLEELVNTPGDQIKPPPLLPVGSYLVGIMGQPELVTSSQKQTPGYRLKYKFFQAREDVNQDALRQALTEGEMSLGDVEMSDDFWLTDKSLFVFKDYYVKTLGIPENYSPKQAAAEMAGKQLIVHIRHRPRQGTGLVPVLYAEIDSRVRAD